MAEGGSVSGVVAVLRALRRGPSTIAELADATDVHWRAVYRIVHQLRDLGAPLKETVRESGRGVAPTAYALTVDGLREWLG